MERTTEETEAQELAASILEGVEFKDEYAIGAAVNKVSEYILSTPKAEPTEVKKCDHPKDKQYPYHDRSIKCGVCDEVIEQNGIKIEVPPRPVESKAELSEVEIINKLIKAHTLLAKCDLDAREYNPISHLLAEIKLELFSQPKEPASKDSGKQTINYMQVAEQSDEEIIEMYMKSNKKELATMLMNCNKHFPKPTIKEQTDAGAIKKLEEENASLLALMDQVQIDRTGLQALERASADGWIRSKTEPVWYKNGVNREQTTTELIDQYKEK